MAIKYYNRNIYKPGTLYNLYKDLKEHKASQQGGYIKNRLKEQELSRLVEIYAAARPGTDFLAIKNEDILKTPEGNEVTGKDFKAMIRMVYEFPRGQYSDIKQVENTSYNCAVPLGLLAYRNYYNKSYNDFRLQPEDFEVSEEYLIEPANEDTIRKVFNLDLLLGSALASTKLTAEGTLVEWNSVYGLASLCAIEKFDLKVRIMKDLREPSFGNRRGHFTRGYGANYLKLEDYEEEYHDFLRLYNSCNQTLKHMLLQRWVYYMPNNSNMITDFRDWDKPMASIDELIGNVKPMRFETTEGDIFGL